MFRTFQKVFVPPPPNNGWGIQAEHFGGINNAGAVTGDFTLGSPNYPNPNLPQAFSYAEGALTPVTGLPGSQAAGVGINNLGQVVGTLSNGPVGPSGGFLWSPDGSFQTITKVPGSYSGTFNQAYGVNDLGQVVGADFSGGNHQGFVWNGGNFAFFQVPSAATEAHGINNAGVIVGTANNYGFIDFTAPSADPGSPITHNIVLMGIEGATIVDPMAINNENVVVGKYFDGRWHGFIDDGGQISFINVPGDRVYSTEVNGINDQGQISGNYSQAFGIIGNLTAGFIGTPLDPTSTLVDQDYVMGLGREADPGGLKFWTDQIESGGMTAEDFRQLLVASGEFQSQHGSQSNWDYVSDLYLKGLGRYPELDGGAFWAGHLNDGTLSRSDVLGALAQSPEGQQHFALSH